ncbi:hypothetical protein OAN96_00435 [Candidatus Gracilibacteria bacterium]|nr:hypothetical protein [Candidatus Gracilibacteria bacterium]
MDTYNIHDHMSPEELAAFDEDMMRLGNGEILPIISEEDALTLHSQINKSMHNTRGIESVDVELTVEEYEEMIDNIHEFSSLDSNTSHERIEELIHCLDDNVTEEYDYRHIDSSRDTSLSGSETEIGPDDLMLDEDMGTDPDFEQYKEIILEAGEYNDDTLSHLQEYIADEKSWTMGEALDKQRDEENNRIEQEKLRLEEEKLQERKKVLTSSIIKKNENSQDRADRIHAALEQCNYQCNIEKQPSLADIGKLIIIFYKDTNSFGMTLGNKQASVDMEKTDMDKLIKITCSTSLEEIGTGMHNDIKGARDNITIGGGAYLYLGDNTLLIGNTSGDYGKMDKSIVQKCLESGGYKLVTDSNYQYCWCPLEDRVEARAFEPGSGAAKWVGDFLAGKTENE